MAERPSEEGTDVSTVDFAEVISKPRSADASEVLVTRGHGRRVRRPRLTIPQRWRVVARRLAVLVAMAVLGTAAWGQVHAWLEERAARHDVRLSAAVGVWSSSTSPPAGRVDYFVMIHNKGSAAPYLTDLQADHNGLRLRSRSSQPRLLSVGDDTRIPLSVLLDCSAVAPEPDGIPAAVEVRIDHSDGGSSRLEIRLAGTDLLDDAATTLCSVRPELKGFELSGPVLRR